MTEIKAPTLSPAHRLDVQRSVDVRRAADNKSLQEKEPPNGESKTQSDGNIALSQKVEPLTRAAEIVEAHLKEVTGLDKRLTMEVDREADVVIYKAIDQDTGKVIKQFPPEEMVKLLARYRRAEGLAVDGKI